MRRRLRERRSIRTAGWTHHLRGMASAREQRQVLEVLPAPPGPPFVAFLVLGADQAVRPAAAIGRQVEVGLGPPNAVLDMAAVGFRGLQYPGLPLGVSKEASQFGAVPAAAGECGCPAPIGRRRQGLGGPERAGARRTPPAAARPTSRPHPAAANQSTNCRNEDGIEAVGLWSGQDVVHRPLGQRPGRSRRGRSADRRRRSGSLRARAARTSSGATRPRPPGSASTSLVAAPARPDTCCGPRTAAVRPRRSAQAPKLVAAVPATMRSTRLLPAAAVGGRSRRRSRHCRPCRRRPRR